jgi:hypothetical protein
MYRKSALLILLAVALIGLSACTTGPCKVMTLLNRCPHEKQYQIYGRVMDMQARPVEDCKVVLIKRNKEMSTCATSESLGDYPVASTDITGDYSFQFEPLGANDIWVYFDASSKGYTPQMVELNTYMGPTFFQAPGNNPVVLDITMEKEL